MTGASIFRSAAQYIRTHGWQPDGMGTHGGPRCSMGALQSVWLPNVDIDTANTMYRVLYQELRGATLTEFNHSHDGEEVAQLFEKVADELDPGPVSDGPRDEHTKTA